LGNKILVLYPKISKHSLSLSPPIPAKRRRVALASLETRFVNIGDLNRFHRRWVSFSSTTTPYHLNFSELDFLHCSMGELPNEVNVVQS